MRNKIFALFLFLAVLSVGCKSSRELSRDKTETTTKEVTEVITKRIGDTVRFEIPKVVYKDTIITVRNRISGTTQVIKYDSDGRISATECISGFVDVVTRSNKEVIEAINKKDLKRENEIPSIIILYIAIGIALIIAVAMLIVFSQIKKQGDLLKKLVDKVL